MVNTPGKWIHSLSLSNIKDVETRCSGLLLIKYYLLCSYSSHWTWDCTQQGFGLGAVRHELSVNCHDIKHILSICGTNLFALIVWPSIRPTESSLMLQLGDFTQKQRNSLEKKTPCLTFWLQNKTNSQFFVLNLDYWPSSFLTEGPSPLFLPDLSKVFHNYINSVSPNKELCPVQLFNGSLRWLRFYIAPCCARTNLLWFVSRTLCSCSSLLISSEEVGYVHPSGYALSGSTQGKSYCDHSVVFQANFACSQDPWSSKTTYRGSSRSAR